VQSEAGRVRDFRTCWQLSSAGDRLDKPIRRQWFKRGLGCWQNLSQLEAKELSAARYGEEHW
jgi:hypothetical protein